MRLGDLQDRLDLRGVVGNGIQPSVLRDAGIEDVDMLLACTPMDETNLVACKVAHDLFNVPTTIARLRSPEFEQGAPLLGKASGFAVDEVICPEASVTAYIRKLIEHPEALQVLEFAGGLISLIAVRAVHGGPLVRHSLAEITRLVPGIDMRIVAIYRGVQRVAVDGDTRITKALVSRLTDSFLSIKPLKSMAREYLADAVLVRETTRLNRALKKQIFAKEALKGFQEPVLTAFVLLGLYVLLVWWQMPVADLLVLTVLLGRVVNQLGKIQLQYQEMGTSESAYWSLQQTIEGAEAEKETTLGSKVPSLIRGIRLDRVTFAYGDRTVLRDASVAFPGGSFTAIVGPSGVGKTTGVPTKDRMRHRSSDELREQGR